MALTIVHMTSMYYPVIGGVELFVKNICELMASSGHEVHVFASTRDQFGRPLNRPFQEIIGGVHVHRLSSLVNIGFASFYPQAFFGLRDLNPDIVEVHSYRHPYLFIAKIALMKKRGKLILCPHSPFYPRESIGGLWWALYRLYDPLLGKITFNLVDGIIAQTEYEKYLLVQVGARSDRIEIIPHCIDDLFFNIPVSPSPKEPVVLYLGRIHRAKNISFLIRAMKDVISEISDARLIIAGPDWGDLAPIMDLAKRLEIESQVKYAGVPTDEEKVRLFRYAKIYVLPSLYEGFGGTLVEALALGRPVVATYGGCQRDIVKHMGNGILVKPSDYKALAEAITKLLSDRELYSSLSLSAREWARQFSCSRVAEARLKAYSDLLNY